MYEIAELFSVGRSTVYRALEPRARKREPRTPDAAPLPDLAGHYLRDASS